MDKNTILSDITSNFATNSAGLITAAKLRTVVNEFVNQTLVVSGALSSSSGCIPFFSSNNGDITYNTGVYRNAANHTYFFENNSNGSIVSNSFIVTAQDHTNNALASMGSNGGLYFTQEIESYNGSIHIFDTGACQLGNANLSSGGSFGMVGTLSVGTSSPGGYIYGGVLLDDNGGITSTYNGNTQVIIGDSGPGYPNSIAIGGMYNSSGGLLIGTTNFASSNNVGNGIYMNCYGKIYSKYSGYYSVTIGDNNYANGANIAINYNNSNQGGFIVGTSTITTGSNIYN